VQDPARNADIQNDLREILRSAARPDVQQPTPDHPFRDTHFTGQGHTLGSESSPSQPILPTAMTAQHPPLVVQREFILWRNGVSFDDGRFFSYEDPSTGALLRMIRMGQIPRRLIDVAPDQEVRLRVHKRDNEDYSPSQEGQGRGRGFPVTSFMGHGNRLGRYTYPLFEGMWVDCSVVPGEQVPVFTAPQSTRIVVPPATQQQDLKPPLDESQPFTTMQIRLADGARITAEFNLSSTVEDMYYFVGTARPLGGREFVLQTIFPTRVLERGLRTIEQEGLGNGTVVMRWKH